VIDSIRRFHCFAYRAQRNAHEESHPDALGMRWWRKPVVRLSDRERIFRKPGARGCACPVAVALIWCDIAPAGPTSPAGDHPWRPALWLHRASYTRLSRDHARQVSALVKMRGAGDDFLAN